LNKLKYIKHELVSFNVITCRKYSILQGIHLNTYSLIQVKYSKRAEI